MIFVAALPATAAAVALALYLRAREWNEELSDEDPLGTGR